jgi:hypothetical protein
MRLTGKFGHRTGIEFQKLDKDSDDSDDVDARLGTSAAQLDSNDRFTSGYKK